MALNPSKAQRGRTEHLLDSGSECGVGCGEAGRTGEGIMDESCAAAEAGVVLELKCTGYQEESEPSAGEGTGGPWHSVPAPCPALPSLLVP